MKSLKLVIPGIIMLALISCDYEEITYDEISSDLSLNITETHPNDEICRPVMNLEIVTEDDYPCVNYQLVTRTTTKGGNLQIQILGSEIGDICLTAIGPAYTSLELEENIQRIVLTYNGKVDEYLISISESTITTSAVNSNFSAFEYSEYYRYPENSFAFLCGTLIEDSIVCGEFEQILLNNLSLEEFSFPSSGKIPYPASSSGYWFNAPAKYYKYQEANDLEKAGSLLNSFYSSELSDKQGLGLSIVGWNNTYFRNDKRFN